MSLTARLGFDAASSPNRLLVITKRTSAEYDGVAVGVGTVGANGSRQRNHRRSRGSRNKNRHQRTSSSVSSSGREKDGVVAVWWRTLKAAGGAFWAARARKGTTKPPTLSLCLSCLGGVLSA
jgi:hypothetical protein